MNKENMELLIQKIRDQHIVTSRGPYTEEEIVQFAHELDKFSEIIIDCYLLEKRNKENIK